MKFRLVAQKSEVWRPESRQRPLDWVEDSHALPGAELALAGTTLSGSPNRLPRASYALKPNPLLHKALLRRGTPNGSITQEGKTFAHDVQKLGPSWIAPDS